MTDLVNHPPHYTAHPSGVECIQITEHMGFCLGNAVKYIWRADLKSNAITDLEKARWYIEREIQRRTEAEPQEEIATPSPDSVQEKPARAKPLRSPARATQRAKFKPGPKWTPEEDERAIEMTARGFTISEVAKKIGRPEHGTRKRLLKFSSEIKDRASQYLAERPEPPCNGFTPEMDARLSRYMAEGLGIGGAASMLKIHRNKVQARWDEMQVKEAAE